MRNKCLEYVSQIVENLEKIEENRKHIASEEEFYTETAYSDSCYVFYPRYYCTNEAPDGVLYCIREATRKGK